MVTIRQATRHFNAITWIAIALAIAMAASFGGLLATGTLAFGGSGASLSQPAPESLAAESSNPSGASQKYALASAPDEVRALPPTPTRYPVDIAKLNPPKTEGDVAMNVLAAFIQEEAGWRNQIKDIEITLHSPKFLPRGIGSHSGGEVTPATAVVTFKDGTTKTFRNLPLVGSGEHWGLITGPVRHALDGRPTPDECFGKTASDALIDACVAAVQQMQR